MAKPKTWVEAHEAEKFGDGVLENCKQCKTCSFWDGGTDFSNNYRKGNCAIYVHPDMKPIEVIKNIKQCEFYEQEIKDD